MQRAAFIAGSAAVLAARPVRAQTISVADLVERFPGIIGIYCRTLTPAPPLVAVRANEQFAAASIIKLPVMLTVYRAYERKTASPDEYVTLLPGDITEGAPILGDAHSGQRWPIGVLVNAMIKYSDNIASNALISGVLRGQELLQSSRGRLLSGSGAIPAPVSRTSTASVICPASFVAAEARTST